MMPIYCTVQLKASSVGLCAVIYNLAAAPVQRADAPPRVTTPS